jgi:hypothetical protein
MRNRAKRSQYHRISGATATAIPDWGQCRSVIRQQRRDPLLCHGQPISSLTDDRQQPDPADT